MVGVGVNVTLVPEQIVELLATIETEGVKLELTVITTELEVPVEIAKQVALLVITTVTISLFANAVDV